MKHFAKFATAVFLAAAALSLSACGFKGGSSSAPVVEIVERSDLLNRINTESILDGDAQNAIAGRGFSARISNVRLTSDYTAEFDLTLTDCEGRRFTFSLPAFLSYDRTVSAHRDSFDNVQIYRGKILADGEGLTLISPGGVFRIDSRSGQAVGFGVPENFERNCVVGGAYGHENGRALLLRENNRDYLALYDSRGRCEKIIEIGESGLARAFEDGNFPTGENMPAVKFCGGDLLMSGGKRAYYYMRSEDVLLQGGQPLASAEKDGVSVNLYRLRICPQSEGKTEETVYLAVKTCGNSAECVLFDDGQVGGSLHSLETVIGYNTVTVKCRRTGVELDMDFAFGKIARKRYIIPPEILGEKLYTSKNKAYSIYSFAPESRGETETVNFALKENATGKTAYLGCGGLINNAYAGEAGFLSDEYAYVFGDNDYKIYSVDVEKGKAEFILSQYLPLGENFDKKGTDRILAAVLPKDGKIIAVYYDKTSESGGEISSGKKDGASGCRYKIALFDGAGNITAEYETDMRAASGYRPLTVYAAKDKIIIYVTDGGTDNILAKGTLDLESGEFLTTQDYRA